MLEKRKFLIAGLGNPGPEYQYSRHNIGFMVIDQLAKMHAVRMDKSEGGAITGHGVIGDTGIIMAKPMSYMNLSGRPIGRLKLKYRMLYGDIIVIHDDIDLAFERLKIKMKGGDGGHNGLRSIIDALGDDSFIRIRMGVGRPQPGANTIEHVLGSFENDESGHLEQFIDKACKVVATILCVGAEDAMNRFNRK